MIKVNYKLFNLAVNDSSAIGPYQYFEPRSLLLVYKDLRFCSTKTLAGSRMHEGTSHLYV